MLIWPIVRHKLMSGGCCGWCSSYRLRNLLEGVRLSVRHERTMHQVLQQHHRQRVPRRRVAMLCLKHASMHYLCMQRRIRSPLLCRIVCTWPEPAVAEVAGALMSV
jgi:hypothetical protein